MYTQRIFSETFLFCARGDSFHADMMNSFSSLVLYSQMSWKSFQVINFALFDVFFYVRFLISNKQTNSSIECLFNRYYSSIKWIFIKMNKIFRITAYCVVCISLCIRVKSKVKINYCFTKHIYLSTQTKNAKLKCRSDILSDIRSWLNISKYQIVICNLLWSFTM